MLIFARRKFGKGTIINQYLINYRFDSNKHTHVFVRDTSFLGFCYRNMFLLVRNLSFLEIT